MTLVRVSNWLGSANIIESEPSIETVPSAVYVPFHADVFFDIDSRWGVYHEDGSLVDRAAYKRGNPPAIIGQSLHSALKAEASSEWERIPDAPPGDYLYVGPLIPHYGHYLLSSLSRLWPLITGDRGDAKLLFHACGDPKGWFETSYVGDTLGALGLTTEDFVIFDHPVRIKNLRVPETSFSEMSSAHRIFARLCHRIGQSIAGDCSAPDGGKPVYLSKTKLNIGVGRMANEAAFVQSLQSRMDLDVCYPEELTLAQQIRLFASNRLMMGTTSSAFHTSIFVDNNPRLLGISLRPFVPSNFKMIDDLNGNTAAYISNESGFASKEHVDGFLESFHVSDPDRLASDIVEFLSANKGDFRLNVNSLQSTARDHEGVNYRVVLDFLHRQLSPKTYFEIGTLDGGTLAVAHCRSIAVDPQFRLADRYALGSKEACHFFQMKSDDFFARYNPAAILGAPIDMAFLDGMHRCEFLLRDFINTEKYCKPNSVIVLHDCLPLESPMAEREEGRPAILSHRNGWWTGDVWRALVALRKYRPDLSISSFDAAPTGLVIITNLCPSSTLLTEQYATIVADMLSTSLDEIGVEGLFKSVNVEPTDTIMSSEKLTERYWL